MFGLITQETDNSIIGAKNELKTKKGKEKDGIAKGYLSFLDFQLSTYFG